MKVWKLFLLFLLIGTAFAGIENYKILSEVDGNLKTVFYITISNPDLKEIENAIFTIPQGSKVLSVKDTYGSLKHSTEGTKLLITFTKPIEPKTSRLVIIELALTLSKKNGFYEYLLVLTPPTDVSIEHVLKLPKGSILYAPQKEGGMVVPQAEITGGENVIITWKLSLQKNMPEVFLVRFKTSELDFSIIAIILFSTVILSASIFYINRRILPSLKIKKQKKDMLGKIKILNEREKMVLEEVINQQGISQREIQLKLGFTKASTSKIVSKLVFRELLEKKKYGKTNKLYAGKKLKQQ